MKRLLLPILALPLLGLWGLGIALHSPLATSYLLRALARHIPGLEIGAVQGALSGPLTLKDLDWSGAGARVHLDHLALDWRPSALLTGRLRILSLQARGVKLRLPAKETPAGEPFALPRMPALHLPLAVDLYRLQLDEVEIEDPASGSRYIERIRLGLSARDDLVRLDGLEFTGLGVHLSARGRIRLSPRLPLRLRLRWRFQDLAGEAHLRGNLHHLLLDQRLTNPWTGVTRLALRAGLDGDLVRVERLDISGPGRLAARGTWSLRDQTFRLHIDIQDQRWPLEGPPEVWVPRLRLDLSGRPEAYALRLQGRVKAPGRPTLDLEGQGRGDLEALQISALQLHTPHSQARIRGGLTWAPLLSWDLDLTSKALDPAEFAPAWPGRLQVGIHTQGRWPGAPEGHRLQVQVKTLNGRLRGRPLKVGGRLALRGQSWRIEDLQLTSGKARVEISGRLDRTLDLRWALQAADLADLLPTAAGRLQAQGRAWGDPTHPQLRGHIQGRGLSYDGQGVSRLEADLDLGLAPKAPLRVKLRASDLDLSGRTWRSLRLNLQGHREAHRIALDIEDPKQPALHLQAQGGLDGHRTWNGRLQALDLDLHEGGRWHLAAAQSLTLGADRQYLGDACLVHAQDRLCYGLRRDRLLQAHLGLPHLDLGLLHPWLPAGLELEGTLTGKGRLRQSPGGPLQGDLQLGLQETRLQVQVEALREDLDLSGARLSARADGQGLKAELHLPLKRSKDGPEGQLGDIQAKLRLADLSDPKAALQGRLDAHIDDIAFLAALVPQVTDLRGRIRIAARVSGTRTQPQPQIDATLEDAAVAIPMTGLELKEIRLSAHNQGLDRIRYEGTLTSGGHLTLRGETRLEPSAGWPTSIHIEGKNFVAADLPEAHVEVSPDLDLSLKQGETRLEGTLKIPFARLRPRSLPETAVSGSSDLVVAATPQALGTREETDTAHRVYARIRLQLGKRVDFEGFGLRARFGGDLVILERPHHPPTANGRITIEEGTYRAYGQDLTITQGMLFYADTPVDNPGIQLRAERKVGEVTAGLEVQGTLKRPRLSLYSTPPMTQNEILSYLVLGHAPGEGGGTDLGSAAAGAVAGKLVAEAGRQLGLDQLRVDNASNLDQASLVAGTYLSPDLYVEYVQHVGSPGVNLKIRYDINDRLQLESETGEIQGLDLYYTIER